MNEFTVGGSLPRLPSTRQMASTHTGLRARPTYDGRRDWMKNILAIAAFITTLLCGALVAQSTTPPSTDPGAAQPPAAQPVPQTSQAPTPQPTPTPQSSQPSTASQPSATSSQPANGKKIAPGTVIPVQL